jgi:biopolymer transport protein ExbD
MLIAIFLSVLTWAADDPDKSSRKLAIVPIQVADAATDNPAASNQVLIHIENDGHAYIDNTWVVEKEALDLLVKLPADTQVVIVAEPQVPYEVIASVITWAKRSGLQNIAIQVEEEVSVFDPLFSKHDTEEAEDLNEFEAKDLRSVKPKHWKLGQKPYGNTDYTAYALEWGETKIGLGSVTVGVLPRIQLGTYPVLDVLGIQNLSLKGNLLRNDRLDAAGVASLWWIPTGSVLNRYDKILDLPDAVLAGSQYIKHIFYVSVGLRGSLRILEPWSAHIGASYIFSSMAGNIDFETLPDLLLPIADQTSGEFGLAPHLDGEMLMVNLATDLRFNRRDSLVLMGRFVPFARARVGINIDEWAGVDTGVEELPSLDGDIDFSVSYGGITSPTKSYSVAVAWQFSWKHIEARVGYGISAVPYTWIIGPFDMSYRFGGKTRRRQTKMKRGWKSNRMDLRKDRIDVDEDAQGVEPSEAAPEEPPASEEPPAAEPAPAEESSEAAESEPEGQPEGQPEGDN